MQEAKRILFPSKITINAKEAINACPTVTTRVDPERQQQQTQRQ